jgi:hypothetical protein
MITKPAHVISKMDRNGEKKILTSFNSEFLSTSHGPAVILLYCGKEHQGNPERITRPYELLASSNA